MRVMYVACNPDEKESLLIEREITDLQRKSAQAIGDIDFLFYPHLTVEDLPGELGRRRPDIVHFSAHGEANKLVLSNEYDAAVPLTGKILSNFFNHEKPPQLVYLNACDSQRIAEELTNSKIEVSIGATAPISNKAARASAALFYERLIDGASVGQAFDASRSMVEAVQLNEASISLYAKSGTTPASMWLHRNPKIVARFATDASPNAKGDYDVEFGLTGCPGNTIQLVFFTDDKFFIEEQVEFDDEEELARELCRVVRDVSLRNRIWSETVWATAGDFRLVCCGLTAGGMSFSVVSTLCDALKTFYLQKGSALIGTKEDAAIGALLSWDGRTLSRPSRPVEGQRVNKSLGKRRSKKK